MLLVFVICAKLFFLPLPTTVKYFFVFRYLILNFQDLPDERYTPPVTIRVSDCRPFGRNVLAGSYVINSLQKYIQKADDYKKMIETDNRGFCEYMSLASWF